MSAVTSLKKHHRYHKLLRSTERFKAHDENNEFKKGDKVLIQETRPLSRQKRWNIVKLILRPKGAEELESSIQKTEDVQ